jgi:hypothetical protein
MVLLLFVVALVAFHAGAAYAGLCGSDYRQSAKLSMGIQVGESEKAIGFLTECK